MDLCVILLDRNNKAGWSVLGEVKRVKVEFLERNLFIQSNPSARSSFVPFIKRGHLGLHK